MNIIQSMAAISLGAVIGANLRWWLGTALNALFPAIPPGTLVANLLGAWLMGIAMAVFLTWPGLPTFWRLLVITGLLGALTTFSSFSGEMFANIQSGRPLMALGGIAVHVVGSLAMVALGMVTFRLGRVVVAAVVH